MKKLVLRSGAEMPALGYGTFFGFKHAKGITGHFMVKEITTYSLLLHFLRTAEIDLFYLKICGTLRFKTLGALSL